MTFLRHILIAAAYSVIAAGVALALPRVIPGIELNLSVLIGGVMLLGSALLHEVFARQDETARLVEEVYDPTRIRLRRGARSWPCGARLRR